MTVCRGDHWGHGRVGIHRTAVGGGSCTTTVACYCCRCRCCCGGLNHGFVEATNVFDMGPTKGRWASDRLVSLKLI